MKILRIILLVVIASALSTACEYDNPQPFPVVEDTISFSADIQPYFDQNCNMAGCHITGAVKPDLTVDNMLYFCQLLRCHFLKMGEIKSQVLITD